MITEIEQETSDFDWFFVNEGNIGFVTSFRGKLPPSVSNKSMDEIINLAAFFRGLPQKAKAIINPNFRNIITHGTDDDKYLLSWVEMAEKGLFSFDKTVVNSPFDTNYHLVAYPLEPLNVNDLPSEIRDMLAAPKVKVDIYNCLDVSMF